MGRNTLQAEHGGGTVGGDHGIRYDEFNDGSRELIRKTAPGDNIVKKLVETYHKEKYNTLISIQP
jgi:hypothetical protein